MQASFNKLIVLLFILLCTSKGSTQMGYPIPEERGELMFYIQRNHNSNTIVYDAKFDENGQLNESEPIKVYWLRYEEQGQKMDLRSIEKWYAYGVKSKKIKSNDNTFELKLVADDSRRFLLQQTAAFDAFVSTKINNRDSKLHHLYIYADNSGLWPEVKYIELFGEDLLTGKDNYQRIIP